MRIRRNETIVKHVSSPQFMPTSQHELTCDDRPKILQPTTWDKKKQLLNDQFKHRDICGYVQ